MKTINTINTEIIAKAAAEAGIKENDKYDAYLISGEDNMIELLLETEWNRIVCYADTETEEILGIMAEPKSMDELIAEGYIKVVSSYLRQAA